MWLFDWFWATLQSLGLYNRTAKILFLGLDNAGKTTLLSMLRDNRLAQHSPTQKPTMEELVMGNITLRAYDLGGHSMARRLWREYFAEVDGVVFLVDVADAARFAEARTELQDLLEGQEMQDVPFLVLGNKIDAAGAASEADVRRALGLAAAATPHRPVELFMCSIRNRQGYAQGFQWLAQFL